MRQIENDRLTGERDRLEEKSVELSRENEELAQMKASQYSMPCEVLFMIITLAISKRY